MNKQDNTFSRFDNLMNFFLKITVPLLLIIASCIYLYYNHEKQVAERQARMEGVLLKSAIMNFAGKDSLEVEEIKKELKK